MGLSFFSFLMAVLWSSLFFCILALLQKDVRFIRKFGIPAVSLVYLGCILRILLPVEFPFTRVVQDSTVYAALYRLLCLDKISIGGLQISIMEIFAVISFVVTVLLTICLSRRYLSFQHSVSVPEEMDEKKKTQLLRVLNRLYSCSQYDSRICISYSSRVRVPAGIGLWNRRILLPHLEYSDTELYYILLHEFTHFANRDLFVKMAIALLCNLFWWNPFVYLLRRNLDEILEIKCDLHLTAGMKNEEKADYLSVIISSLLQAPDAVSPVNRLPNAQLADARKKDLLRKRFSLTATPPESKTIFQNPSSSVLCVFLAAVTFIGSYSFLLQPSYPVPSEEFEKGSLAYEMTPENTYLSIDKNGQYTVTSTSDGHTDTARVTAGFAETLIEEGYTIKNYE